MSVDQHAVNLALWIAVVLAVGSVFAVVSILLTVIVGWFFRKARQV